MPELICKSANTIESMFKGNYIKYSSVLLLLKRRDKFIFWYFIRILSRNYFTIEGNNITYYTL